jgi:hypothetical protein
MPVRLRAASRGTLKELLLKTSYPIVYPPQPDLTVCYDDESRNPNPNPNPNPIVTVWSPAQDVPWLVVQGLAVSAGGWGKLGLGLGLGSSCHTPRARALRRYRVRVRVRVGVYFF